MKYSCVNSKKIILCNSGIKITYRNSIFISRIDFSNATNISLKKGSLDFYINIFIYYCYER